MSFITFGLLFSLEFILVYVLRCGSSFIFIQISSQLSQLTFSLFIYFYFGCVRSLLLLMGFLWSRQPGATLCCSTWAQHGRLVGARAWARYLWRTCLVALGMWNLPDKRLNLCPHHWQVDSYPL